MLRNRIPTKKAAMKTRLFQILVLWALFLSPPATFGMELGELASSLTARIPFRPFSMTGSQFAKYVSAMDESLREQAILAQLLKGNIPDFLRRLTSVQLSRPFEDGKSTVATIFVMPDYLAIGSDRDFLRIPMGLYTALEVADRYGFILPTRKMVDAIFKQAAFRFAPDPLPAGPQMRSTTYYSKHNGNIMAQRPAFGCPLEALVSGHKKDVVLTNRLTQSGGRVAIYGWHRPSGIPIQPLTTVHRAEYADYSHGIRLVGTTILLDGKPQSIFDVLENSRTAQVLSDEGPIQKVRQLMALRRPPAGRPAEKSPILQASAAPQRLPSTEYYPSDERP